MRLFSLFPQQFPLADSKPMLFIGDHQCQIIVYHLFLYEGMGSDNDIRLMGSNLFVSNPFFLRRHGACNKYGLFVNLMRSKQLCHGFKMLLCQSSLISVIRRLKKGKYGNNRLTGAYVSLNKPVHDPASREIAVYLI